VVLDWGFPLEIPRTYSFAGYLHRGFVVDWLVELLSSSVENERYWIQSDIAATALSLLTAAVNPRLTAGACVLRRLKCNFSQVRDIFSCI